MPWCTPRRAGGSVRGGPSARRSAPSSTYSSVVTLLAELVADARLGVPAVGKTTSAGADRPDGAVDMPETMVIGKFEPLGAVDGHDPHGVVVALGQDRLGHPRPLGRLRGHPVQVLAQVAARGLAPGPGLVDHETQPPPHVAGPALGEAELEGPPVPGDPPEQLRRGQPSALVVEASADRRRPARTGIVERAPCRAGRRGSSSAPCVPT